MPNHPHEFTDTDPRAMEAWLELLRSQSAAEKIAAVLNSSRAVLQMYEMGVRRLHPDAGDREVLLRVAARHLPTELMIRPTDGTQSMQKLPKADGIRSMTPTPLDRVWRILGVLDQMEIPYLIGGSVASSVHGISRPTMALDIVVDLQPDQIEEFAGLLPANFYADVEMMREALARGRSFNLIHYASSFKIDMFPLKSDDYSRASFQRRRFEQSLSLGPEPIECAVATAEDTILRKLEWYRAGGETSERQWPAERYWNDLRGVLKVSDAKLDYAYLHQWAPRLRVDDLLAKLLAE